MPPSFPNHAPVMHASCPRHVSRSQQLRGHEILALGNPPFHILKLLLLGM